MVGNGAEASSLPRLKIWGEGDTAKDLEGWEGMERRLLVSKSEKGRRRLEGWKVGRRVVIIKVRKK